MHFRGAAILLPSLTPKEVAMSTDTVVDFLIAFLVIMVVALQVQIIQLKKRIRDIPSGVPKS